jgi:hypothetical protein
MQVEEHLEQRLRALETFAAGGQVEDVSALVIPRLLTELRAVARELPDDEDAAQAVAERVTDLLVAGCLVVSRGTGRRAEVVTPERLQTTLQDLAVELQSTTDFDATSLGKLGTGASLAEDMLRLNLLGLSAQARDELADSKLFKALAASEVVGAAMLAASGHEEQHFLSTCGIASVDQAVLSQVGSIAGLVFVGRKVLAGATRRLTADENALRAQRAVLRHAGKKQSLWAMCERAIDTATQAMSDIETRALRVIADGGPKAAARLRALTLRWGKAMQRVMGVISGPLLGADTDQSILTEKYIGGQWLASAVLAAVWEGPGIFWRGEADARSEGPDAGSYRDLLASELGLTTQAPTITLEKSAREWRSPGVIDKLWRETAWRGGVPLDVPGHSLYLRAVRRHGRELFLLGEPKGSAYERKTKSELISWMAGKEIDLPFDPFA